MLIHDSFYLGLLRGMPVRSCLYILPNSLKHLYSYPSEGEIEKEEAAWDISIDSSPDWFSIDTVLTLGTWTLAVRVHFL